MLKDSKTFSQLERTLRHNGTLGLFEEEQGMIRRRMMITEAPLPEALQGKTGAAAFEASFDTTDATLSVVVDLGTLQPLTGITASGGDPGPDLAEAFIRALLDALGDDFGFSLPVYTFLSDFGHYSITPGR